MIRVAIVDDHPVVRQGVARILEPADGIEVVAAMDGPGELSALLTGTPPAGIDAVVLDLYLDSDTPALEAIGELSASKPVLVMSASRRPGDVLAALQEGASGYITKHASEAAFVAAVRAVAAGEFYLSAQLADILHAELGQPAQPAAPPRPALSDREQEVLSYVARGFTHSQTAARLGISLSTVDTYIRRIRAKLQVGNKAQLTLAALEQLNRKRRGG